METEETQSDSFMEAFGGKPSGPIAADQVSRELDEAVAHANNIKTPVVIYSLNFDAEQLLTAYGALTTYLKILCQESQDFEMIKQVSTMLIEIKPRAVEASKSLALKSVGMKGKNGD